MGKYETQCEPAICSEELLGVTNQAGGTVKGKYFLTTGTSFAPVNNAISRQICVTTQQTRNLFWKGSRTKKEKEEKVRKQRYTMTFPTKEEVNFALRFETFDRPPYGKESRCNSKGILEGYASTKTGYRLPNVHTF